MIYLSHFLNSETPCYGGRSENLQIHHDTGICSGKSCNSLHLHLNNHVGTHVDFPKHFDDQGKTLSDYEAADFVFNKVCLIDLPCAPEKLIAVSDLEKYDLQEVDLLLIRTGFEAYRNEEKYWKHNPGILPETGFWLRDNFPSLKAIGFDFISLSSYQHREIGREAHRAFLNDHRGQHPIIIIEDMKLAQAPHKLHRVIMAPLMVENADGIQVTVMAE